MLYRAGEAPDGLEQANATLEALADRQDRPENRYWTHTIRAHRALHEGSAQAFVDEVLALWGNVISPLEVPFETYQTLALTQSGNAGFVRTLPHLYESVARLVLVQSQASALDGDIDPLGAIVRVLTDQRLGADPEAIPADASSKAFADHVVARLDGAESDGGSLSYTLALIGAERAHQRTRAELAERGFSPRAREALRESVAAYQRALRNANTLQGQVAVYTRALRQLGEVHATGERLGQRVPADVPFGIDRALELYDSMHAARDEGWDRHGYVDAGREAYVEAMHGLWSEIQEASFNAASEYLSRKNAAGEPDDESIVHAIHHYSRILHAFDRYAGDPRGESLPDSAYFGVYVASRGIGDGVLFFAGGDASAEQLDEAVGRYVDALEAFPFDRELWSTLAVALQRSGSESEFLTDAKPIAERVVGSRHLDRWIRERRARAETLTSFRDAFANDRSLVYFGFADPNDLDVLESEFARLEEERTRIGETIAAAKAERSLLHARRAEAHRAATRLSGEESAVPPPGVAGAPPFLESGRIAELGVDLERLSSDGEIVEARIDAISQSLPIYKATLGHEDLIWELAARRDHPVHSLLRRYAEELAPPSGETASTATAEPFAASASPARPSLDPWLGGLDR